jgi:hypothetical protein
MKRAIIILCWAVAGYLILPVILGFLFGLLASSLPASDSKDAALKNIIQAIEVICKVTPGCLLLLGWFGKLPGTERPS